ncbi:MAG: hypothetical protein QOJ65_556 [Fimbriimonadaceae bacterium]|jgi:hypothetical protein|nr:hypothetical protein [Fimbriimonadaceae bacterium]
MMRWTFPIGFSSLALLGLLALGFREREARTPVGNLTTTSYPYEGEQFTKFVADSYRVKGSGKAEDFYSWFDRGFKDQTGSDPSAFLAKQKEAIAADKDVAKKAAAEQALGGTIHRLIKKIIPKFSLQRGFEFYNTEALGERQCFLQSVLVCGLLQEAGVDSGVAMVYKNIAGQETNNGHAVAVARLSDGKDVLVDCSDPVPFVQQKGLYLRDGEKSYVYVRPQYDGVSGTISSYAEEAGGKDLKPERVALLDVPFVNSMFDYYRGERTPRGFFETPSTKAGLELSAVFLEKSVQDNPKNPLAVYMLGHVYQKLGKSGEAKDRYVAAKALYAEAGWIPQGMKDALSQ